MQYDAMRFTVAFTLFHWSARSRAPPCATARLTVVRHVIHRAPRAPASLVPRARRARACAGGSPGRERRRDRSSFSPHCLPSLRWPTGTASSRCPARWARASGSTPTGPPPASSPASRASAWRWPRPSSRTARARGPFGRWMGSTGCPASAPACWPPSARTSPSPGGREREHPGSSHDRAPLGGGARHPPTGGRRRLPLNLNSASVSELDGLPGIGPARAAAILQEREARGPFASVEDLSRVPGLGPSAIARLRDRVVVR